MAIEECEGIVLARHRYSETSWTLRVFTREHGRLDLIAKGARRPKSPMYGRLDLYNRESLTIYPSRRGELDLLAESYVFDEHIGLRRASAAFAAAGMLGEAARFAFITRDPHPAVYAALARALRELSAWGEASSRERGDRPASPGAVLAAGLWTMLSEAGYTPRVDGCVGCGRAEAAEREGAALSAERGGIVCRSCRRRHDPPLGARGARVLRRLAEADGTPDDLVVARATPAALADFLGRSVGHGMASARVWRALPRCAENT